MTKYKIVHEEKERNIEAESIINASLIPISVIFQSPLSYMVITIDKDFKEDYKLMKDDSNNLWLVKLKDVEVYKRVGLLEI